MSKRKTDRGPRPQPLFGEEGDVALTPLFSGVPPTVAEDPYIPEEAGRTEYLPGLRPTYEELAAGQRQKERDMRTRTGETDG